MNLPISQICQRLQAPDQSVWAVHYDALEQQKEGRDVIVLSVGDPDFATPEQIIERLVASIRNGRTHYSPAAGEDDLRLAIAQLETEVSGRQFDPQQFVIMPGATAALYGALACVCDPGDEVIVPQPMYIGYQSIMDALGLKLVPVPLDLSADCRLDTETVLAAVTERTRAVLINTPGNPFGNIVPPETLAELSLALLQRQIWLVCDEVYSLITFEQPHVSLLKCASSLDNVIVIDGLSKSHAMTGWRIGWVASPPHLTEALSAYSEAAFFGCSQFIQDAAAYALRHDMPHVQHMREAYRARRDTVLSHLQEIPGLGCIKPQAGMFVMMDVSGLCNSGTVFAQDLLAQQGVSVIPGEGFGERARGYVRLSLTLDEKTLAVAMSRIADFVAAS